MLPLSGRRVNSENVRAMLGRIPSSLTRRYGHLSKDMTDAINALLPPPPVFLPLPPTILPLPLTASLLAELRCQLVGIRVRLPR